jgi:uncharacterized membrane protein
MGWRHWPVVAACLDMGSFMAAYLLAVYLHIFATVLWVGYILFWAILVGPLIRKFNEPNRSQLLTRIAESTWPPALVPISYRLKLHQLGWIALVLLAITGGFILYYRGVTVQSILSGGLFLGSFGQVLAIKLILVAGLAMGQLRLTHRPAPRLIYLELLATLAVVGLSVALVR